ncbi:Nitrite reductase [NAD(P)H] [compost metagenome]
MPANVSVAVSASPLHHAGTLTKELGIVGVPGGWEIYVGGCGGTKLRQAELLCSESNEDIVLELASAFLQWYREEANFGETTGQWVERKGITPLREGLFDLVMRAELIARMQVEQVIKEQQLNPQLTAALAR